MDNMEFVQRVEYLVKDKSHTEGDIAFQVYHSETDSLVLSVKQCSDYLDNSKIIYDAKGTKLLKMRRDQGRSVMPMYIHDYRSQTEYRWKSKAVEAYTKKDKAKARKKERHVVPHEYMEGDESYGHTYTENKDQISDYYHNNDNDNNNNKHSMSIASSVDKLTFEITDMKSGETVAFVSVHEQIEAGVCSYKVSANSDADVAFIMTLVISVDERYMGMARLKGTAISTGLCTIQ